MLNQRWDVLVWNRASELLFGDFGRSRFGESNALRFMFFDPVARQRIPDWEHHARRMAAQFRLAYDHLTDRPEFHRLATDLRSGSADFERAWMSHDVMSVAAGRKEIIHPHLGHLRFEHGVFGVNENPALKMVIYVATKENDTAHKMSGALA